MQQEEAASAPSRPLAAAIACPRPEAAVKCSLTVIPPTLHPVVTTGSRNFSMREITGARAAGMTIGELSQLTGVNIETIRYYEKIKVLPAPSRAKNGRRVYGPTERRILPSCGARASWGFHSTRCARCYDSAVLKRPRAVKFGRLPD